MGLVELLVYGFMFAAFLLFNYVSQQAARRRRQQQRKEQESFGEQHGTAQEAEVPAADPFGTAWGRTPEALPLEVVTPFEVAPAFREEALTRAAPVPRPVFADPARVGRRRNRTRFLRTQRDLQNAVVAMTVLGPCRALQPYDMGGNNVAPTARR